MFRTKTWQVCEPKRLFQNAPTVHITPNNRSEEMALSMVRERVSDGENSTRFRENSVDSAFGLA